MNLMIVHPAVQNELISGRLPECEARRPVLVVTLREGESSLREIDGGAIRSERIVRALKSHAAGIIEDGAPPTGRVGEQRRTRLFVDRHLLHLPDAIERRERSARAPGIPGTPGVVAGHAYEPQTEYDLRGECDPVDPDGTGQWRFHGKRQSDQACNVGGQEKAGEQDEVE